MDPFAVISRLVEQNPFLGFASGMVTLALILRYFQGIFKNDQRSENIDKANDALTKRMQEDIKRLTDRCDDLAEKVRKLELEREALHRENIVLREENVTQRGQINELKEKVGKLELEAALIRQSKGE